LSSSKAFVLPVKLRDALLDIKGLSPEAKGGYTQFWYVHEMYRQPLPPREEKLPPSEWDEWFRDQLDLKNVRTWRRIRDELLAKARIRRDDDGRLYIGRTMRAVAEKRGEDQGKWGGETVEPRLDLQGVHPAQIRDKPVGQPVEGAGQLPTSGEVRAMIGQTSPDVRPILVFKPLIRLEREPSLSNSKSKSHEFVAAVPFAAPRARGDPTAVQA